MFTPYAVLGLLCGALGDLPAWLSGRVQQLDSSSPAVPWVAQPTATDPSGDAWVYSLYKVASSRGAIAGYMQVTTELPSGLLCGVLELPDRFVGHRVGTQFKHSIVVGT